MCNLCKKARGCWFYDYGSSIGVCIKCMNDLSLDTFESALTTNSSNSPPGRMVRTYDVCLVRNSGQ